MQQSFSRAITRRFEPASRVIPPLLLAGFLFVPAFSAQAAVTDIANNPLATTSSINVKPNILFVLDDSGSMAWGHMPDSVTNWRSDVGYKNYLCNSIYYDPNKTYKPPLDANGNSYSNASFTAAWDNGFNPVKAVDLSSKFQAFNGTTGGGWDSDVSGPAYYYEWKGAGDPISQSSGGCSVDDDKKTVTNWEFVPITAAQQQNFANWYSYYRTRILTMKTAGGAAFAQLDDSYRVGFLTINPGNPVSASKFLAIGDFDSTQKNLWYNKLYGAGVNGGTPLREALSRAGRYFAGQSNGINSGMSVNPDPVQYSCQRNYSILTTDGLWNGNGGVNVGGGSLNTNQDGDIASSPRPFFDGTGTSGYGSSDSLADVAMYYYNTDLRPNMPDDLTGDTSDAEADSATHQHMTTFTMGLGVNGMLNYQKDYKTATSGDFAAIRSGALNWPKPTHDTLSAVDDLWHAAVNGRGRYFSAKDPQEAASSLTSALNTISGSQGNGAGITASNPVPTSSDNTSYTGKYKTSDWWGDIEARTIDLSTVTLSAVTASARSLLDAQVGDHCDKRSIYLFRAGATDNRTPFTWNTKACDSNGAPTGIATTGLNTTEQAYFDNTEVTQLTQAAFMSDGTGGTVNQTTAAAGANLVNFVRGQRGNEQFITDDSNRLYRTRTSVLGDIIDSQPAYVGKRLFAYADSGYATYKATQEAQPKRVYVAANDGMLHSFDATTLKEQWAFIPSIALPSLYMLADTSYSGKHHFLFDGTPVMADVQKGGVWSTILVTGMGRGASGYMALDITDPDNPKGLWEFKHSTTCYDSSNSATFGADCALGLSIAEPRITKLTDGTWVVLVTSGLNNADGIGYLYVLDALTGRIKYKISTNTGSASSPSGVGKITTYGHNPQTNDMPNWVYAGDLLGNIWRFDINDTVAPAGREATLVATLKDPSGNPQPITSAIVLTESGSPPKPMVLVGTGRYLGASDVADTQQQTVYGIRDLVGSVALSNARSVLTQQSLVASGALARKAAVGAGCKAVTRGWYIDLLEPGERVNVDPLVYTNRFAFASNTPAATACSAGGTSVINYVDAVNGCAIDSTGIAGISNPKSLISGITLVVTTSSDGSTQGTILTPDLKAPLPPPPGKPYGKRVGWRTLTN